MIFKMGDLTKLENEALHTIREASSQFKNPAGAITDEAWDAIRAAVSSEGRTKVLIDGEEDLLTVVTVLSAPLGSLVVYGQPNVGVVVVKVTKDRQQNMRRIVGLMKETSKS